MKRVVLNGNSDAIIQKLDDMYKDFSEIKKITTYLNQANFLFDEYPIFDTSVDMILENFNGQLVYISGLNCGYIGTGPRSTQKLLVKIGFSYEESNRLILNEALKIEFKERGDIETVKINSNFIFENTNTSKCKKKILESNILKYYIDEWTKIDLVNKKIYIQNPQKNSLLGLLYLINLIDVSEVEYYIGNKSKLEESLRADELYRSWNQEFDYGARGVNLIVRSNKFDIICFINTESQVEVISTVYYEIFKESNFKKIYNESSFILTDSNNGRIRLTFTLLKSFFVRKILGINEIEDTKYRKNIK